MFNLAFKLPLPEFTFAKLSAYENLWERLGERHTAIVIRTKDEHELSLALYGLREHINDIIRQIESGEGVNT